ncbi:MAG: FumA C-terminus/TtdB family hydratase beta subunit [Candidatus Ornithospirochaeta sp.]
MERILDLPAHSWSEIRPGDKVILNGRLYVGRDQAHRIMTEEMKKGGEPPFPFIGNAIYYMGPSPAPEGLPIGSAGPTTSGRMDPFSSFLMEKGLKIMVGKGPRSKEVVEAVKKNGGLYLQAFGGCGALYSSRIISSRTICYDYLGPEAVLEMEVRDFPTICIIDSRGEVFSPET